MTGEPEVQFGNSDYDVLLSILKATVSAISVIPCGADQVQRFDKDAV
jgi:hypothetical protein